MSASGEDLKKYLIVPSSSSFSFTSSSSSPTAPSTKPIFSGFGIDSEYRCAHAQGTYDKAEKQKMEIDTPMPLPVFNSPHAEENVRASAVPLDGVFSMEDFMKQHEDEHQAQLLAREAKQTAPPAKKIKTDENAAPLTPIAVGARSSKYTILLHEKYQALGIPQPLFTYEGGSSSGWTVSISFPGLENAEELQGLAGEKKFNSKQEAKEALSQKALAVLEKLEKDGRVKKAEKGKRKSIGGSGQAVQQQQKAEKEPGENYIGQLLGMPVTSPLTAVSSIRLLDSSRHMHISSTPLTYHQNSSAPRTVRNPPTPTINPATASPASSPSKATPRPSVPSRRSRHPKKPRDRKPPATLYHISNPKACGPQT